MLAKIVTNPNKNKQFQNVNPTGCIIERLGPTAREFLASEIIG